MPSPRPSGSGAWKILVLPHSLQYEVFHLVAFPSYSSKPRIGSFEGSSLCRFLLRGSDLGLALLWTIATNMPHLTAVVALHLGQAPFAHLLLALVVSFPWFEGRFGHAVDS